MRKIYFTDKIMRNAKKLREQLNLMQSQAGTSRTVERLRTEIRQATTNVTINGSTVVRHGAVAVIAGVNSISFSSAMTDNAYEFVRCDEITSGGDLSPVVQRVITKSASGFTIDIAEAGTLYYYVSRLV